MKYFIAYSYTKGGNPFPMYGNKIIDTEWEEKAWEDFLDGQPWCIEKLLPEYNHESTSDLTIICVSEIK